MKKGKILRLLTILITIVNMNEITWQNLYAQSASESRAFVKKAGSPHGINLAVGDSPAAFNSGDINSSNMVAKLIEENNNLFAMVSVINNSGKNYLHWIVSNDKKNGIFVIERSENGIDFVTCDFKVRISSLVPQLSYYFRDSNVTASSVYYRVLAMGEDGSFKYSDVVRASSSDPALESIY